ncbi:MAG: ABC transporter ATP-binding protein [Corynebacterium sp.]|nr:ABC transporter ATP-binding protein [Corynebacterium sp.]
MMLRNSARPAAATPALSLHGVSKSFSTTHAVQDISLEVARGELFSLLGPNGAGKTTTISMCEGFITPDAGEISVVGFNPRKQRNQMRARIGIMLQAGGSYSGIKVGEQLQLAASYYENPLDIDWLAELLALEPIMRTTYRRLSGGQKQRLSLALALLGRPELVFLDEPTAGMDAQSRHLVWELLAQLKADGVTVVLTTHFIEEAQHLSDRVAIMDHGKIVACDSPQALIAAGDTTARFETTTALDIAALSATTGLEVQACGHMHYDLLGTPSPEALAALAHGAAAQDVLIAKWYTNERSLEDVFLDLTGRQLTGIAAQA